MSFFFESKRIELKEEIDVMSTQDFIGNLGVSLGMFFGFFTCNTTSIVNTICFEQNLQIYSNCQLEKGTRGLKENP